MTHHENKSVGDLNDHIHLKLALSDVVLESSPNQKHCLRLTAVLTAASVAVLWINKQTVGTKVTIGFGKKTSMIPPFIVTILLEVSPFPPTYSFQTVPVMKWKLTIVFE